MATPIVIIHGWSDTSQSFVKLAGYLQKQLKRPVEIIRLADWTSMDDHVTYQDLRYAMQRAWRARRLPKQARSVDLLTHSTGALVVRDWMTKYYRPATVPVKRLLMLAPANFGSPLAHKGRAFYGRIIKGWRHGLQTGSRILEGLELAAPYTWQLAQRDIFARQPWYGRNAVMATVLVGNTGYSGVRAAANEDGGDGTVRVSTANLNAAMVTADFSNNTGPPKLSVRAPRQKTAFAVLDGDSHGSIIMKEGQTPRNAAARGLFLEALEVEAGGWKAWCDKLDAITDAVTARARPRGRRGRHAFQNTVVRVRDNLGHPVRDYFIEFYENDSENSPLGRFIHSDVIQTVHACSEDPSYRSVYVDVTLLHHRIDRSGETLKIGISADPPYEEGKTKAGYPAPGSGGGLPIAVVPEKIREIFAPHRTLLADIIIKRQVADEVFSLRPLSEIRGDQKLGQGAQG